MSPTEAKIMFKNKFKNIKIDSQEITRYIETKYRESNKINNEYIGNYKSIINIRDNDGNKISQIIEFNSDSEDKNKLNNEKDHFIIIGNSELFSNLKDNLINQFFMDCTYSAVPPSINKYKLLVICGYNSSKNKTVLCCFILIRNENEITFTEIFKYLYETYSFNPKNVMVDFNMAQINGLKNIYGNNIFIHGCFFYYSQAIWRNFRKNGLCYKNSYSSNSELLFNLQLLAFIERTKIKDLYNKITHNYSENKYKKFFNYFNKTWLGSKYPSKIWNYYDIIKNNKNYEKFYFTNNLTENINRYLNNNLKRAKCSKSLFRECILNIILQFSNKIVNSEVEKTKSEILKFYVNKKNKINLLNMDEIKKINFGI